MRRSEKVLLLVCVLILGGVVAVTAQDQQRETVAILDFSTSGDIDEAEMRVFVDFMTSHIFATGRYRVVDRMQRDTLLDEIEFSVSDISDEEKRLAIGRQLSADRLIVGSLGRIGDRYLMNMKLVDVMSGETLNSSSERYNSINDLIDDSEQLALRLMGIDEVAQGGTTSQGAGDDQTTGTTDGSTTTQTGGTQTGGQQGSGQDGGGTDPKPEIGRRGSSVEAGVGYAPGFGANLGFSLGYTYQFSDRFSLGAYGGGILSGGFFVSVFGGRIVLGNKVDRLAVSLNLSSIPGVGIYFKNWMFSFGWGGLAYLEAGRSFYFGR